jgi:hypothetical protein
MTKTRPFLFASFLVAIALCLAGSPARADDGDALLAFSITVKPGDYLVLHDGKAYAQKDAIAHKLDLDFVYLAAKSGSSTKKELFNLSGKDTKLPAEVLGTRAGIVALTWDDDTAARCKTVADLKRMTSTYTANSFSFYGTFGDNATGDLDQKRFIYLDSHGRMGILSAKRSTGDEVVVDVLITP